MQKTLLITLDYPPMVGGVSHYYHELVQSLPSGDIWVLDNEKNELLYVSNWIWPRWLKGVWNTIRAVRRYHIQHLLVGQVLPIGTIALIVSKLYRIPYTVMTHAMDVTVPFSAEGSPRKQKMIQRVLKHAQNVTTVSQYTKQQLIQIGVPEEKIVLIHPAPHIDGTQAAFQSVDSSVLDNQYALQGKRVMLTLCRLVRRKGVDTVLEAMKAIQKQFPDVVYCIVGEGEDRERLETLVVQNGLEDVVRFIGSVTDSEAAQWYARSACYVMPSRQLSNRDVEGFGITFLEANSFGLPVIGGNSGGVPDAIIDGETGYLVDPTDPQMLYSVIRKLLEDEFLRNRLGAAGKKRVAEEFQWKHQAQKLEKLLTTPQ